MKPNVYVTRILPESVMQSVALNCEMGYWAKEDGPVPRDVLLESVQHIDGLLCLLTDKVDEELLMAAPRLRVVANMAVGFDNIDVDACTRHGVMVTNTPGVLTETTADLAFGLMLATARRIPEGRDVILRGEWKTWSPMFLAGRDVYAQKLGIVGMGRIGSAVARRARGFDMQVFYWDKERLDESCGAKYMAFDDLLKECDFISVHLPLTPDTKHMFGKREFSLMKPTAVFVNTARGPIVDSRALYEALTYGQIWAAALDVFEVEPIAKDDKLANLPNVVAVPHIASASVATRTKMAEMAADNLMSALSGNNPPNLVNPTVTDSQSYHEKRGTA